MPAWRIAAPSWMMTGPGHAAERALPPGYLATTEVLGDAIMVKIATKDGALAASGYAASASGVFVFDRIVTELQHRRRGLGGAVMALLARASGAARPVLVATSAGRALYDTLGWRVHAPYASAVIPDPLT